MVGGCSTCGWTMNLDFYAQLISSSLHLVMESLWMLSYLGVRTLSSLPMVDCSSMPSNQCPRFCEHFLISFKLDRVCWRMPRSTHGITSWSRSWWWQSTKSPTISCSAVLLPSIGNLLGEPCRYVCPVNPLKERWGYMTLSSRRPSLSRMEAKRYTSQ